MSRRKKRTWREWRYSRQANFVLNHEIDPFSCVCFPPRGLGKYKENHIPVTYGNGLSLKSKQRPELEGHLMRIYARPNSAGEP